MKILRVLLVSAVAYLPLRAVEVGATYEQVIAEKGAPAAKLQAGDVQILNYPDQRIKLKGNKVVEVNAKLPDVDVAPAEAPAPRTPAIAPGTWTTDYPAALKQARQQKTKILLFFTGSDWCGWCKRLDAEVLTTSKFKSYAGKNLILVKLDFPQGIPQSTSLKAQNQSLAQHHKVTGFPTIVVVDGAGKTLGRLSYQPGGPGPFIDALEKL